MHALIAIITAFVASSFAPRPPVQPAEQAPPSLHHMALACVSASDAWNSLTTSDGRTALADAPTQVDLRIGGAITAQGVTDTILAYEPNRMIAIRTGAPRSVPANARASAEKTWTVFRLEPLTPDRTRISVTLLGFDDAERDHPTIQALHARNVFLLKRLSNAERRNVDPKAIDDAEKLLFSLAGKWSFDQPRPDGTPFSGTTDALLLFDAKFLFANGHLTIGDRTVHHSHFVAGRDPETLALRAWNFSEEGHVTEGQIRLAAPDTLIIDWTTHATAGAPPMAYLVEYTFDTPDTFRCKVLAPPNGDGERATVAEVTYRRTR